MVRKKKLLFFIKINLFSIIMEFADNGDLF